jgi:hypothetical protein
MCIELQMHRIETHKEMSSHLAGSLTLFDGASYSVPASLNNTMLYL